MNYAMLNDISSMTKNKLSNRHQIMPTSTKKPHTTQRGVGGMRRRPGKFSKSKFVLHKMSARSGLVGKKPPGPIWGYLGYFVYMDRENTKKQQLLLIFLGGPI